jgi:putative peptidoglycan lipid II flippase
LKHNGIALAGSVSAMANVLVLAIVLRKKIGVYLERAFYVSVLKMVISSLVMLGAMGIIEWFMPWQTSATFRQRLIYLCLSLTGGGLAFFISAYVLKSPEIHAILDRLKTRLNRV